MDYILHATACRGPCAAPSFIRVTNYTFTLFSLSSLVASLYDLNWAHSQLTIVFSFWVTDTSCHNRQSQNLSDNINEYISCKKKSTWLCEALHLVIQGTWLLSSVALPSLVMYSKAGMTGDKKDGGGTLLLTAMARRWFLSVRLTVHWPKQSTKEDGKCRRVHEY